MNFNVNFFLLSCYYWSWPSCIALIVSFLLRIKFNYCGKWRKCFRWVNAKTKCGLFVLYETDKSQMGRVDMWKKNRTKIYWNQWFCLIVICIVTQGTALIIIFCFLPIVYFIRKDLRKKSGGSETLILYKKYQHSMSFVNLSIIFILFA